MIFFCCIKTDLCRQSFAKPSEFVSTSLEGSFVHLLWFSHKQCTSTCVLEDVTSLSPYSSASCVRECLDFQSNGKSAAAASR